MLAVAIVGTVISLIFSVFIETILKLLIRGAVFIGKEIMDVSLTVFNNNGNIIQNALDIFGLEGSTIADIFVGIGKGTVLVLFLIQIIESLVKSAIGEECEHPLKITGRCIAAYLMIVAMFGTKIFNYGNTVLHSGLLGLAGNWGARILSYVTLDYSGVDKVGDVNLTWISDMYSKVGAIILYGSLMGSTLGACISYVERFASLGLTVVMGPICLSLSASKEGQKTAKTWVESVIIQMFCIFLSLLMWAFFLNKYNGAESQSIFEIVIMITALNLMKDSEQIFKALGFHTMPNIDTAKTMMGGVAVFTKIGGNSLGDLKSNFTNSAGKGFDLFLAKRRNDTKNNAKSVNKNVDPLKQNGGDKASGTGNVAPITGEKDAQGNMGNVDTGKVAGGGNSSGVSPLTTGTSGK